MKLLAIEGENFGVLDRQPLAFAEGLQVIYGPNEAGKSTLLRLIRETLFGFPHARHELSWKAGQPAGQATLKLNDGRTLVMHRQKGRPDSVTGHWEPGRKVLDSDQVEAVLRGASSQVFNNLFAISLRELMEGEESLKRAGLGESLFSGGWGGLERYRSVQLQLTQERERLFKTRGRTQLLHKVLGQLSESQKQYQDSLVSPAALEQLKTELKQRIAAVETLQETMQAQQVEQRRLEQLQQAAPLWHTQQALDTALHELQLPTTLTGERVEELWRLRDRYAELEQEIFEVEQQVAANHRSEVPELTVLQTTLLQLDAQLRGLEQQLSQQLHLDEQFPGWELELREVDFRLQRRLDELGTGWTLAEMAQRQVGISQREAIQELLRNSRVLREQAATLQGRLPDIQQALQLTQERLAALPPPRSITALEDLLERSELWREQQRQLEQLQQQLATLESDRQRRAAELSRRLKSARAKREAMQGEVTDWSQLPTPFPAVVEECREQLQELAAEVKAATRQVERTAQELRQHRHDLSEFDRLHPTMQREHLIQLRKRRNQGWDLIRQKYIEAGDAATQQETEAEVRAWLAHEEIETDLASTFETLLVASDHVADQQLTQAEFLAKRDQLIARIERLESQQSEEADTLLSKEQQLAGDTQAWQALWEPAEIVPGSPAAMLEWLQLLEQCRVQAREAIRVQDDIIRLEAITAQFIKELQRAFPQQLDPLLALREGRQELDHAVRTVDARQRLELEQRTLQAKVDQLQQEELALAVQRGAWESQQSLLLQQLNFPATGTLEIAEKVLLALAAGQEDLRQQQHLAQQVEQGGQSRREFAERLQTIVAELTPAGLDRDSAAALSQSPALLLQTLAGQLAAAHSARLAHAQYLAAVSEADRKLDDLRQTAKRVEGQLQVVKQTAGLEPSVDLVATLGRFEQRQKLAQQRSETSIRLQQIRVPLEELKIALVTDSEEALRQRAERLTTQLQALAEQHRQELQRVGVLRKQLTDWTTENPSDRFASQVQSQQAELGQVVERWASFTLAEAMLQRALSRFEEVHQPRLLGEVGTWIQRLTCGRYRELQQVRDQPDKLRVVDEHGEAKTPEQLSSGTREQLFLAIRLAYVANYARDHDPLPMVLDDVLVNFDDVRARETLQALQEFSGTCQILLLTCHHRTVELCRSLPQPGHVLELGRGALPRPETPAAAVRSAAVVTAPAVVVPVETKARRTPKPPQSKVKPGLFSGDLSDSDDDGSQPPLGAAFDA